MQTILIQEKLPEIDRLSLQKEFTFYRFLFLEERSIKELTASDLAEVEVIYGYQLPAAVASQMHQLKWVHCSKPWLEELSLEELPGILITATKEENMQQAAEFVFWSLLEFYKQGSAWLPLSQVRNGQEEKQTKLQIEQLAGKKLLQLGLGRTGSLIAQIAKQFQMKVFGVQNERRFHPFCDKTFGFADLHTLLPNADVISLTPCIEEKTPWFFGKAEWALLKADALFIGINALHLVDLQALYKTLESGRLRGVVFDGLMKDLPAADSPLRKWKKAIFTPEIAFCPRLQSQQALHIFRYNLRHYIHGNANEMKNQLAMK
ncbi:MAG: hypothetical protein K0S07_253 [Chlamydiales bacterium]|jgi:phosphoglycerate dehydrogenase-like enzyme|nr:hypothetical protein [Chlamydiales bacterium]